MKVITTEKLPIKMWLDEIEDGALQQAKDIANLPFAFKHVAIMPDSHEGYGMPIGGVLATEESIIPNAVGVDIGCGMRAVKTSLTDIDSSTIKVIMGRIREEIPLGFNHNKEDQVWTGFDKAPDSCIIQQELSSARKQLGTLGGGNHFIEIQKGSDGAIWVMLHSGSRNLGLKTANYYHRKAQSLCSAWYSNIPNKDLSFFPFDFGNEYYEAMRYCLDFALENRRLMMGRVVGIIKTETSCGTSGSDIDVHHNYAAYEHHFGKNVIVHRKGAVRARLDEVVIIPGSMGSCSYIAKGLGNQESFCSSSHGSGRKMGRGEAKRSLNLGEEIQKMSGIIHGLRNQDDLDEAPGAYKDIDKVMENQRDLVEIVLTLRPLASIKG